MTRDQRFKHEMFVRVSDFGTANRAAFPESSTGGNMFAQVSTAVAEIEEHLASRILGRVDGRGVKPITRTAVFTYMKTIARAARRVTRQERSINPFRMPLRRTLTVELSTAQVFIMEAEKRQEKFVAIGLPPTFISDFKALVDEMHVAMTMRLGSKRVRGQAQAGIAAALARGFDVIQDLDVVVEVASRLDPVMAAAWRSARRIEGQGSSTAAVKATNVEAPIAVPAPMPVAASADVDRPIVTANEVMERAS